MVSVKMGEKQVIHIRRTQPQRIQTAAYTSVRQPETGVEEQDLAVLAHQECAHGRRYCVLEPEGCC